MAFSGSDTQQLRDLAARGQRELTALQSHRTSLTSLARSLHWEGPDAADFRHRWEAAARRWSSVEESMRTACADLIRQAQDQDRTSSVDGSASGTSSTAPPPGEHHSIVPTAHGGADEPARTGRPPQAPERDAAEGRDAAEVSEQRHAPAPKTSERDLPDDEMQHPHDGQDHSTTTDSASADGASAEKSVQDGKTTTSHTLRQEVSWEEKVGEKGKGGSAEAGIAHTVASEYTEKHNPDGSTTYSFKESQELREHADATVKTPQVDVSGGAHHADSAAYTKEVTVPKGTTAEQAARVDPRHPDSMPAGSTVKVTEDTAREDGGHVGVGKKGVPLADYSGSRTTTQEQATVYAKDDKGHLSLDTGDKRIIEDKYATRFGGENFNVTMGNSHSNEHGTTDHVQFSSDEAGKAAYERSVGHGLPKPGDDGVDQRWQDTRTATDDTYSRELNLGALSHSTEKNIHSDELLVRDYLDGDKEYARQIQPQGDSSQDYVMQTGGTSRPTTYEVSMGKGNEDAVDEYEDDYGIRDDDGHATRSFTQDEADRMMKGGNDRTTDRYHNPADYFSHVSAREHNEGGGAGWKTLYQDANGTYDDQKQYREVPHPVAPGTPVYEG